MCTFLGFWGQGIRYDQSPNQWVHYFQDGVQYGRQYRKVAITPLLLKLGVVILEQETH